MGIEHASLVVVILSILFIGPVFYFLKLARNRNLFIRKIPGIDAIDHTINQSVEAGRPISFTTGLASIGPVLYACLGVLYFVANRAAKLKADLIVPQYDPEVLAIAEDVVSSAYATAGRESDFSTQQLPYLSNEQFAYAAGYIGMIQRENVGAAFLFGEFAAESLILAESGQAIGAEQVGATVDPEQVAFFIVACNYTLIGEETYAAAAYLTQDPIQVGSLYAQDFSKLLIVLVIFAGIILATIDSVRPGLIDFNYREFWATTASGVTISE